MRVSTAALTDLGLLQTGLSEGRVVEWIDTTATNEGRATLERLLQSPLADSDTIHRRQRDLIRLAKIAPHISWRDVAPAIAAVRRYVTSTYVELPASPVRCLWVSAFHPDHTAEIWIGLTAVARLAGLLEPLVRALGDGEVDAESGAELQTLSLQFAKFRRAAPIVVAEQRAGPSSALGRARLVALDHAIRRGERALIEATLDAVARLDALCALARLTSRPEFTFPRIIEGTEPTVHLRGAIHPQVANVVPNDLVLGGGASFAIVTGPNMAGKSTLLRAAGICVVLAHVGAPVPATSASMTCFDSLFSALSVRDDVRRAESYFLAEVRQIKGLVTAIEGGGRVFALIDEPFRGTNVADASDATTLLATGLAAAANCAAMLTTHLSEVAAAFEGDRRVRLARFEASRVGDRWSLDYTLQVGVSAQRLGMMFLEREGVAGGIARIVERSASTGDGGA